MLATEADRLDALNQLDLLDTPASESFDRITRMAAQVFDLPIAAVSLTDSDRQWFKSRVGVDHCSLPREKAPCSEVAETCGVLVIEDILADPSYCDSPLAHSGLRFYAGVPLITNDGYGLGALCVLGTEPRTTTPKELGALRDLSAMVMAQVELQHAFGRIDPISGLPNRRQFCEDLDDLARDGSDTERRMAVFLDLVASEQLNHAVRVMAPTTIDQMLKQAAKKLRARLLPNQKAYHVGATQFAWVTTGGVDEAALKVHLDDLRGVERAYSIGSLAIGVAPFVLGTASSNDILRQALSAAQDARATGSPYAFYSAGQDTAYQRSFTLLRDFEAAIQTREGLHLVYQPRVDAASGRCVGVEALMRWQHAELGAISPAEFIPLIEKMTLAAPMTAWVIETALDQLSRWRQSGLDLRMSVNISAANLRDPEFARCVEIMLLRYDVPADTLELEITETAVMDDPQRAIAQLEQLDRSGVHLAIDDFGTGYSSLSYLQRLPVDVVKIDRSFISRLETDEQLAFVELIITMAKHFGRRVVAEGVETEQVAKRLRDTRCDELQGYFFSRPLSADDFEEWLDAPIRKL